MVPKRKRATGQSNILYPRDQQGRLIRRGWANKIVRLIEGYAGRNLLAAGKDKKPSLLATGDPATLAEELFGLEGSPFYQMTLHRGRERKLRERKIQDALASNGGRLRCEVPGCKFDFLTMYGELGRGYAQVHHIEPIGSRSGAERTRLDELVIVCANCHVMIHRYGDSRPLDELILVTASMNIKS